MVKTMRPILPDESHAGCPQDRWHNALYWLVLALACAVFLVMNFLTPYKEDDMGFTLIDGVWAPVRSLGDFLLSCRNHYTETNGRIADLVPALFAAFLGKGAFNVCNTLVFGMFAHLLSLLSAHRRSVTVLALLLAAVGTCYPLPGETMLWMAGSANYLWAITASLLLVYVLQRCHGATFSFGKGLLLFAGAFIAGGFNEATSFGFFAGLCLFYAFNRKRFNRWAAFAMAGYLMGMLLIVSSPAAWNRAASDSGIILNLPLSDLLKARWFIFHEKMWQFYLPMGALAVGILALILKRGRMVGRSVWTYIFLCLTLVMFALGIRHERAYAPWATVAFLIVAMGIDWLMTQWPRLRIPVIIVSLALAVFTFGRGIKVLNDYQAYDRQVVNEINAAPSQAVLQERLFDRYNRFVKPMNFISTNFFGHEAIYRAYYGKKNVQFVNDSVYVRYHEGRLLDGAQPMSTTSDRPDILGPAYTCPGQNYMAVQLLTDTLPAVLQTARYLSSPDKSTTLSTEDQRRRANYGINLDYTPTGFYLLEYGGKRYIITACPNTSISQIVFPLGIHADPHEATLTISR